MNERGFGHKNSGPQKKTSFIQSAHIAFSFVRIQIESHLFCLNLNLIVVRILLAFFYLKITVFTANFQTIF
jgi:hypothetical protein